MKNHRAIVITPIIFIISVLYSYNANASPLCDAINSLMTLIDEIDIKRDRLGQQSEPYFSYNNVALPDSFRLLRLYQASLQVRNLPGKVSSKILYANSLKQRDLRCLPGGTINPLVQASARSVLRSEGVAYYRFDENGVRLSKPECVKFSGIDELKNEEINEKAKEHLSEMFESLENDQVFLTTCTNLGFENEYKITMDLIRAALH
ncbi:hypothetical protein [Endozoicomonas sp. 4G]|uniref:hypothetical protein n=1 Tax=Endozoicomonas sp. 4G TaxID=2872754 RepID=UPI002078D7FF|nr:hypothetical protein [Endozoicomonas sp. 4G]